MDLMREITDNKIVTSSLCDILFGENEDDRDDLFYTSCDYPKVMYNVCLLYSSLIQAYLIACAHNKSCLLRDIVISDNAYNAIMHIWNGEYVYDYDQSKNMMFSFLIDCTEIGDSNIFAGQAKSIIVAIRNAFQRFVNANVRARTDLISETDFLSTLKSFKLLQYTSIDETAGKITFSIPDKEELTIDCHPFIFYIDHKAKLTTNSSMGHPYIMKSSIKGERNGEFRFEVVELNSYNIVPRTIVLTAPIVSNENLLLICKILELPTQWYPLGEYMGDYLFLRQLTDIAEEVVLHFLEKEHGAYKSNQNILPDFRKMFAGTELYEKISDNTKIERDNVDKLLFEFFIKHGVIKTMWCLLFDAEYYSQEEMFCAFLEAFKEKGIITSYQFDDYVSECDNSIESHINKLKTIVVERTNAFIQRSKEIKAEWRAFYVLKAAGIRNDKLFADVENVLSIDDYFDMIHNIHTTNEQNMKDVLSFLISFYFPLVKHGYENEDTMYTFAVNEMQNDLANKPYTVSELFEMFIDIVKASYKNSAIDRLLGRDIICDPKDLEDYKLKFKNNDILQDVPTQEIVYNKYIFISYAHKDMDRVKEVVNLLKSNQCNVFFDEDMFSGGDIWRNRAKAAIRDENCIGVIVFMSEAAATSEPVKYELQFARAQAKEKYPNNSLAQQRFIIPVNLEERRISEYLMEKAFSDDEIIQGIAVELQNIIPDSKMFYRADDPNLLDSLMQYFRQTIEEDKTSGYMISANALKGVALDMANFYTFLKTGTDAYHDSGDVTHVFENADLSHCIFPLVVSVKEARIKRDNVTLLGYEIVKGKGRGGYNENYILSSKRLTTEDYYCIPNYRRVGENCSWMIEPLLVSHEVFAKRKSKESN